MNQMHGSSLPSHYHLVSRMTSCCKALGVIYLRAVTPTGGSHSDIVSGTVTGTITTAQAYFPGSPDDIVNGSKATLIAPGASTHNSFPIWNTGTFYRASPFQSYPSKRTVGGQAAESEMVWKSDWMAI